MILLIITPASKIRNYFCLTVIACSLTGCMAHVPPDALQLKADSLQTRQLQSKKFSTTDEADMLTASMEVLQDMGFIIKESESKLGLIVGSKTRETDNKGQQIAFITIGILAGMERPLQGVEKSHKIRVSLVTIPDKSNKNITVRVNFQRQVWDMEGNLVRSQSIHEPELYTGFFSKLSKSVFLEAHAI